MSTATLPIRVEVDGLAEFCRTHGIHKLWLFGSVLRGDFSPESDVDILVDFEPGHVPGFIGLARLETGLSQYFEGRKIDLNTLGGFRRTRRQQILDKAIVVYGEVR